MMNRQLLANFKSFTGKKIREASGVAQFAVDKFIIVDDRKNHFYLATLDSEGQLNVDILKPDNSVSFSLQDMEGVTIKPNDSWVYAITSYSDTTKKSRQRLARFTIKDGNRISNIEKVKKSTKLNNKIEGSLRNKFRFLQTGFAFNIEAFCWAKDGKEVLIGLRSPIIRGQAVIVRSKGIGKAFTRDEITFPEKEIATFDLKNGGIRAMAFIPDLNGYLLISGKGEEAVDEYTSKKKEDGYYLWFWNGNSSVKEIFRFPETTGNKGDAIQPEGLCAVTFRDGITTSVLIVSDDGDLGDNASGKYWLLSTDDYDVLKNTCHPDK